MTERKTLVKGIVSYSAEFAITLTLRPSMYHMSAIMQRNALQGIINSLENCKISLIVELTQSFNIHGHGTIKVPMKGHKSAEHLCVDVFRNLKEVGYICVKQIEDYEGWQEYCLKDYTRTKQELNENPIIRDDNDFMSPLILQKILSSGVEENVEVEDLPAKSGGERIYKNKKSRLLELIS